ncbi:hypothetical protein E3N88_44509 [Mikania micrantha]|uniref:Uncharacterized protein n=1 Tax=Mikania micrantha TaxID=192012 RepID=A0A5N6LBV0_9ASTR|nr:hypothetical protein E3N88_44509 [Mikania micrantha]
MPKPPNALLSTRVSLPHGGWGVPDPVSACHAMGRPCATRPRMVTRPGRMARPWGRPKATLPLTIPRHVFKSSAKDSTRRLIRIVIQDSPHDSSIAQAKPMTRAFGGQGPYCWSANRRRAHALHLARILT